MRLVDPFAGEAVAMRVDVDLEDGTTAAGIFVHKLLSDSVGCARAHKKQHCCCRANLHAFPLCSHGRLRKTTSQPSVNGVLCAALPLSWSIAS